MTNLCNLQIVGLCVLCVLCGETDRYGAANPISIGAFGCCVFTITALSGCTFTSLYLICSTDCKKNSYDFFGFYFHTGERIDTEGKAGGHGLTTISIDWIH